MRIRLRSFSLILCGAITLSALAQTSDVKALELLDQARKVSLMQGVGLPSYRLEAAFETFNEKGQSDGKGTVVQTALVDGGVKRVIVYRDKKYEGILLHGNWEAVADADYLETFMERHLLDALFDPIPPFSTYSNRTVTQKSLTVGQAQLQCGILSIDVPGDGDKHAVAPSNAYCVDSSGGMLRAIYGHSASNTVLNSYRQLQRSYVPGDVLIAQGKVMRGHIHVDRFVADNTLTGADFAAPEVRPGQVDVRRSEVPHDVVAGAIQNKTQPIYPDEAKRNHISGTVTLNAIIGRDGTIRDLELLTAPDDSLAKAAMEAVKHWKYKPYTVDGKPSEVESTITVHFSFSRV